MCLPSFHLLASILLIHSCTSSWSDTFSEIVERTCSTDDDCAHQLICNVQTRTCICPKPYFWREDIQACFGCAPGWLDLDKNKCLLYAASGSSGVISNRTESICKDLMAQPMVINSTDEFLTLQFQIEDLLNNQNTPAASVYFSQGAWVKIENERTESYPWCNNDEKSETLNCIQVRQNSSTNTICLQYVSCTESAHLICEAQPVSRMILEKNIAESKNAIEQRIIRSTHRKKSQRLSRQVLTQGANNDPNAQQSMTTKKPSSWNADHVTNMVTTGMNAAGQIATAFGNIFGKNPAQNPPQNTNQQPPPVNSYVDQGPPQTQYISAQMDASSSGDGTGLTKWLTMQNMLIVGGFVVVIIIVIIVIFTCFCGKKKSKSSSKSSVRSAESGTSYE